MKQTYSGYEGKNTRGGIQMPPVGQYIAEIQGVRTEPSYDKTRDVIVLMVEITEGEYAGRYHEAYENLKERYPDNAMYKGVFKLTPPIEGDEPWVKNRFESNLWCVEQSNPGYQWNWDENKLVGKKIGINVRKNLYTGKDGNDHEMFEIGQLETVEDVRDGKCRNMNARDSRKDKKPKDDGNDSESGMTNVSGKVSVPF